MSKITKKNSSSKRKLSRKILIIKLVVSFFVFYLCFLLVSQQIKINNKKQEAYQIKQKIINQQTKNQQLEDILNADEQKKQEYIEKRGREEFGLAKEGERVYQGVPGSGSH